MKSKKAGIELVGGETTTLLFGVLAFILIVFVMAIVLFGVASGGPDGMCKVFAAANAIVPPSGSWWLVPRHFCQPSTMIINAPKDCECGVFRSKGTENDWLVEICKQDLKDNGGVCSDVWQERYVIFQLSELMQRCWQMGSAGKLNTGKFACFMVKIYMESGIEITQTELQDKYNNQFFPKVLENAGNAIKINNPLCGVSCHKKGEENITTNTWVGILNCGADPDEYPDKQRILYFIHPIVGEIESHMSSNVC